MKIYLSEKDDLYDYAQSIVKKGLADMNTPISGLQMFGNAACIVLDRSGDFQAELCIFPAGKNIPRHEHPDVDSIEIQITGSLRLFQNGIDMMRGRNLEEAKKLWHKVGIRIGAKVDHSVEVGKDGAVFISCQRWNKGNPDHIGHNWKGTTYDNSQEPFAK